MDNRTVTQEYLDGIRDGRHDLRAWESITGSQITIEDVNAHITNITTTMHRFSSGPIREMLKGERDFWRGQLRRMTL